MRKSTRLTLLILICLGLIVPVFGQKIATFEADTAQANAMWKKAIALAGSGQFRQVLEKMDSAEIFYARSLGPESAEMAKVYFGKAICRFNLADYAESTVHFQQCLSIRERLFGQVHIDVAICYFGLGNIYYRTRAYELAAQSYERYRSIMTELAGPDQAELARVDLSLGNIYLVQGDLVRAEAKYRECLELQTKLLPSDHIEFTNTYLVISTLYERKEDYEEALSYCQKALKIFLKKYPPDAPQLAKVYAQTGTIYAYMRDGQNALVYLQQSIEILLKSVGMDHPDVAESYAALAGAYGIKGDPARALELSLKAADILVRKSGPYSPDLARIYSNAGEFCRRTGDLDRALKYLSEALAINQKNPTSNQGNQASIHLNIGVVRQQKGDYHEALEHYAAAELILRKQNPEHRDIATILSNKAALGVQQGEYKPALLQLEEALALQRHLFGSEHSAVADIYSNMLEIYRLLGAFDEGAPYADSAFAALRYGGKADFNEVNSMPTLLQVLINKGAFYFSWFERDSIDAYLRTARQAFADAVQAIAYQDRYLENPDSRFSLASVSGKIAEGGITTAYALQNRSDSLQYGHEAFDFAQQSKALVLYGSMQEASAVRFAGLPDSLLQQEHQMRVVLAYLDQKRQELLSGGASETDSATLSVSTRLFDLHQNYADLIKYLERTFPDYYRLRYGRSTITVPQVQEQLLQPGQTLLEYVVGDSTLFVFVIGKASFHIENIKIDFPLDAWVTELRNAMTTERSTKAAVYCARAHELYQKLIAPVKERLSGDLIIIPDGVLNYLPFEALLSEMPEKPARFRNHPYLLNEYRISYCYSATLLREMQEKHEQQTPTDYLLAVAPYFSGDTIQLDEVPNRGIAKKRRALRHSGSEVYGIRRIMGGEVLQGEAATKEHFIQIADKYRILHLATHGQAGDFSLVAFAESADTSTGNLLYVRDIYNLALNADLVTLSACETGIGKLQRGEGVISVARAFAYAGAGSIVTSLWDVDDEQSKDLMLLFYKELRKGASKNEALQTAKRTLSKRPDSHPFFWAAFIGIGDMRPVAQTGK